MRVSAPFLVFLLTTVVVFVTRLPMMGSGYGRDPDAWRFVLAARSIATTGDYAASRLPGFPLPEFAYAALWSFPGVWVPLVSLLSGVSAGLFAVIVKHLGGRDGWLAGVALAFVPVIYIHSTTLMDYTWSLAFMLAAVFAILRGHPTAAGVLIGLAAACRITTIVMVLPLSFLLVDKGATARVTLKKLLALWWPGVLIAVLSVVPAYVTYGRDMFQIVDSGRGAANVIDTAGVGVWGTTGLWALAIATLSMAAYSFVRRRGKTSIPPSLEENHVLAWLCAIGAFGILFLRLPHESGYLITIVPFVLLVVARFAHRLVFVGLCLSLIVSPFVGLTTTGFKSGPIIEDRSARVAYILESTKALSILRGVAETNLVIVSGWLAPQLEVVDLMARGAGEADVLFRERLSADELKQLIDDGYSVYVLPIRELHDNSVFGLLDHGAKMLPYWED